MEKYNVNELIFEVTRKCNMKCEHCLRGDARADEITEEIVRKTLENISEIGVLQFGGGEPSLNVPAIRMIVSLIKEMSIPVSSFFIVTNGKVYSQELVDICLELFIYCNFSSDISDRAFNMSSSNINDGSGGLAVSLDAYHEEIDLLNYYKYSSLKFYRPDKERSLICNFNDDGQDEGLLNVGRAKTNGIGFAEFKEESVPLFSYEGVDTEISQLYITAKGEILFNCDLPYEAAERLSAGNVLSTSLSEVENIYEREERLCSMQ